MLPGIIYEGCQVNFTYLYIHTCLYIVYDFTECGVCGLMFRGRGGGGGGGGGEEGGEGGGGGGGGLNVHKSFYLHFQCLY